MKNKVGIYICQCGPNIAENVDIDKIIKEISKEADGENLEIVAKPYGLLCSGDGKEYLKKEIEENELTHLVVAACSPRDHNSTFIGVCKETSLNPYLYQLINIREHCAWIVHDKEKATEKAIQYIRGGLRRVLYQSELLEKQLDINPDILVIGGGVTGMEAALSLASKDRKIYLIEKSDVLGGKAAGFSSLLPRQKNGKAAIQEMIASVQDHPDIQVMLETRLERLIGFLGNFEIEVFRGNDVTELNVGGIVVATGYNLLDITKLPTFKIDSSHSVITSLELEQILTEKGDVVNKAGKTPDSVAMIHCAGRDEVGYCSQICCSSMIKLSDQLRKLSPKRKVTAFIRDLCLPQKEDQAYYKQVQDSGVEFIRVKEIHIDGETISYTAMDGSQSKRAFDLVVAAPAMIPSQDTQSLAQTLGLTLHETGFYQEAHQTTNPVATATDGIFIAGTAHGPRGINASIMQAEAAAGKIMSILIPGEKIVPEVKVSEVLEAYCMGCKTCLEVCHYGAIVFDEEKCVSVVKEAVCRGCGNCAGSCPSGAIQLKHFTNTQLYQEVFEALR